MSKPDSKKISKSKNSEQNKFKHGKIYQIYADDMPLSYIGSTVNGIRTRLQNHRSAYRKAPMKGGKVKRVSSFKMFEMYGVDKCKIRLLEAYPCKSNDELRKREEKHISGAQTVNINRAFRTAEDVKMYYQRNKDKFKRRYAEKKDVIIPKVRAYQLKNKDKIKAYAAAYYQKNKKKIAARHREYAKKYYQRNKEKIRIRNLKHGSAKLESKKEVKPAKPVKEMVKDYELKTEKKPLNIITATPEEKKEIKMTPEEKKAERNRKSRAYYQAHKEQLNAKARAKRAVKKAALIAAKRAVELSKAIPQKEARVSQKEA